MDSKLKSLAELSMFAKKLPFLLVSCCLFQDSSTSVSFTFLDDFIELYSSAGLPAVLHAFKASRKPVCDSASS